MKYLKQARRFLVVTLVIMICSCVDFGSAVRAEETPATAAAVAGPAIPDSSLVSLAAQAAAADIGVRAVDGTDVFHTIDEKALGMN
jgi:hypothetical protein